MKHRIMFLSVVTLALSNQLVTAGSIVGPDYVTGETLSADIMNGIKSEVNDNDTRISALESYSKAGVIHALSTSCHRGTSGGSPLLNTGVVNPPANSYGPSIIETSLVNGTFTWYCNVPIQIPPDTTFTLTGAKLAFFDGASTCLVGAIIKRKTFGTSSMGTEISAVYSGTSNSDFITSLSGVQTKNFPAFTQGINSSEIIFVQAEIKNSGAITATDCRYSGIELTYTVSKP